MERDFVHWLRSKLPSHPLLKIGVGDDAAVLASAGSDTVVTTDLLADGTHFLADEVDPELIGRKCLAANLSDLAAMAAEPLAVVVSLMLPRGGAGRCDTPTLARKLIEGMLPLAEQFDCAIAGGDTNAWDGRLAVSVTAIGRVGSRGPLLRSGAKVGDCLLTTGELGGSIEGHHLVFTPRVAEALLLHDRYQLSAGMDITDGLAIDLDRLTKASEVGAVVQAAQVPTSPAAERLALAAAGDPLTHALADGEDFELLLAVPPADAEAILRDQPIECGISLIGQVVDRGLWLEEDSGTRKPLAPTGYLHG